MGKRRPQQKAQEQADRQYRKDHAAPRKSRSGGFTPTLPRLSPSQEQAIIARILMSKPRQTEESEPDALP